MISILEHCSSGVSEWSDVHSYSVEHILGCTDISSTNYNPNATLDDGSYCKKLF